MRILIATVTAGGGHLQAAAALEEAWRALRPADRLRRVDVLEFTPGVFRKAYAEGYVELIKRAPELYGAFFRASDDPGKVRAATRIKRAFARYAAPGFARLIRSFRPHAVLAPHFLPMEALGGLRLDGGPRPFAASVVTDFEAHALWLEPRVDAYFVAALETKDRLVARGVPAQAVEVTGIPVSPRFARPFDRRALRRRRGLRDDLPVLLVLSGGFGMGPVAKALAALDALKTPVQLVVVCGRNEALRAELAVRDARHPTTVLGFTREMPELMAAADLILSKPGGLTSSEALALGRPLVILDPIPGQESANSDFLLERGAAVKVNRPEDLPARLDRLLGSPRLAALAKAAKALGRPAAAREICRRVAARLAVAAAAVLVALCPARAARPLSQLPGDARAARMEQDEAAILRYRAGMASVAAFADKRADLFPPQRLEEARRLPRGPKEEIWAAWQRDLDYLLALDALRSYYGGFYRLAGEERTRALRLRYAAFLAQYRWAIEFIERAEKDPGLDAVLNDAVPELGLPKGAYGRLKYRFLHLGRAAEFGAMEGLYKPGRPETPTRLTAAIDEDAAFVWRLGRGTGELLTAKNAVKVVRDAGKSAWMPVQSGIAEWMGDVRVRRAGRSLISREQIDALARRLEPGDVMVQRREWFLSNVGIPGWWTHAALVIGTPAERRRYFDDPEVRAWARGRGRADGDFEGLLQDKLPEAYRLSLVPNEGHEPRVIEAIGEGVSFTSLEHSAFADSLAALRPRLSKRDKASALLRAFGYSGRPYDYDFDFATDAALVCSELVYKAYEPAPPGMAGLTLPIVAVMGRKISSPNEFVRQFDAQLGTPAQQFDLAVFLDGHEGRRRSVEAGLGTFRGSWRRPKWHILVQ